MGTVVILCGVVVMVAAIALCVVMVAAVTPYVVLWSWLLCYVVLWSCRCHCTVWCCSCGHCYYVLMATSPLCYQCMATGLQKRKLVEKRKKKAYEENKPVQGAWQHDVCSCKGQGDTVHAAMRAAQG